MENAQDNQHNSAGSVAAEGSNLDLSFPTITVDASVGAYILLPTDNDMVRPGAPSRALSEAGSSLEDSAYDLISNADLSESSILSDDDGRTESLASYDDNTPDDISFINNVGDSDEEEDGRDNTLGSRMLDSVHSEYSSGSTEDEPMVNVTPTIDDSNYTSNTVRPEQSFAYREFQRYVDEPAKGTNELDLFHTIQSLDQFNCNPELSIYGSDYVGVDMVMTISTNVMKPSGPYRVLIVGPNQHYDREIVEHINSAIQVASGNLTRASLDHCEKADYAKDTRSIFLEIDSPVPTIVTLRGGKAFHGTEAMQTPIWDLAIFLHSSLAKVSDVERMENTFEKARLGLRASCVPVMDLSLHHPLYRAVPHTYYCEQSSLHLRVTGKASKDSAKVELEMLPVDVDQFLSIDPRTLNRHLSLLKQREQSGPTSSRHVSKDRIFDIFSKSTTLIMKFSHTIFDTPYRLASQAMNHMGWRDLMTVLAITLVAALLQSQSVGSMFGAKRTAVEMPIPQVLPPVSIQSTDAWSGFMSRLTRSSSTVTSIVATPSPVIKEADLKSLGTRYHEEAKKAATRMYERKMRKEEDDMVQEAWGQYKLDAVNSRMFVLTAPPQISKYLKPLPKLAVTKNGAPIKIKVKSLPHGRWSIDVLEDVLDGQAEVTLRAEYHLPVRGKYPFEYNFAIHTDKSSFEKVKDLVAQEFILVQNNAMELSTRMSTGLQEYIGGIQQQTLKCVNETKKALIELSSKEGSLVLWQSKQQHVANLKKTKKAIRKQGKDLASQIQATMLEARQVTLEQVEQAMKTVRAIPQWQQETKWPVRLDDWKPSKAARRGFSNAQGLLRKLRGGPKTIDAPVIEQAKCRRRALKRKGKACSFGR